MNRHISFRSSQDNQAGWQTETTVLIRVGPQGQCPVYATPGSAGCDLMAAEDIVLQPGETRLLPLDFVMALEPGVEAQIRPRSGLSLRTTLRLPNTPGTIDSDYRAPVGVLLENTYSQADLPLQILRDPTLAEALKQPGRCLKLGQYLALRRADAEQPPLQLLPELAEQVIYLDAQGNPVGTLYIRQGERIAQMIFSRCLKARFVACERPEDVGIDRGGGFGSTGV